MVMGPSCPRFRESITVSHLLSVRYGGLVAQRLEQQTHNALCNRCLLCFSSTYEATGWVQLGRFGHGCGGFGLSNGLSFGPKQPLVSG
jgi:hypothetical protein